MKQSKSYRNQCKGYSRNIKHIRKRNQINNFPKTRDSESPKTVINSKRQFLTIPKDISNSQFFTIALHYEGNSKHSEEDISLP